MKSFFPSLGYRRTAWILLAAYIVLGVVFIFRSSFVALDGHRYFVLFDDGMIAMRYADNLVHHHGLVWNVGEKIEGFTSPLMVLIYAVGIALFGKIYAALFVQLLGLAAIILNVFLVLKVVQALAKPEEPREDFSLLAMFLTMIFYPIMYWTLFGMESGLLVTIILAAVYLDLRESPQAKYNLPLVLCLMAAYLFRAELALFLALFFIFRLRTHFSNWKRVGKWAVEALVVLVPVVGYQMFRLKYYGSWVPNTYILKATGWLLSARLKNGAIFTELFLSRLLPFLLAAVMFVFFYYFWPGQGWKDKLKEATRGRLSYALFFVVLLGVYSAYQIVVGGDAWPPYWRMVLPFVPTFFISFVILFYQLTRLLNWKLEHFKALAWLAAFMVLFFMPFDYNYDLLQLRPYQTSNNIENVNTAIAINNVTSPQATVASFWAGTIPYLTGRYTYDPLGKTDAHIASLPADLTWAVNSHGLLTLPGHNKYDLNYTYVQKQPDVIPYMLVDGKICTWGSQSLEQWCQQHYVVGQYHGVKLLLKKDSREIYWNKLTQ